MDIPVWGWIVIAIVAVIIFAIIMHVINLKYRINYDLNLIYGGLAMLLAEAAVILGILAMTEGEAKIFGIVCIAVGVVLMIIRLIMNVKKCGFGMGFLALILQLVFSVGCIFLLAELFSRRRVRHNYTADRYVRDERQRRETESERRRNGRY